MKKFLKISLKVVVAVVGVAILLNAIGLFDSGGAPPETCEELAPHILELSKKQVEILKLYDVENHNPEDWKEALGPGNVERVVLLCTATARTTLVDGSKILFLMEKDSDGDLFFRYFPI